MEVSRPPVRSRDTQAGGSGVPARIARWMQQELAYKLIPMLPNFDHGVVMASDFRRLGHLLAHSGFTYDGVGPAMLWGRPLL